ncbi:sugar-binding transcriptional regulator [Nakamurella flavida]|nr:sugar-binding domain-containing protein [Nakamurella flavida]
MADTGATQDPAAQGIGIDQLRLLCKVARMYHERGIRQPQIAAQLSLSQPRVSRLLRQATELGIVRTVVSLPSGVYADLEDEVQSRYGLRDCMVVDVGGVQDVVPALGAAAADYLDATLTGEHRIGVSSWSETLLYAVDRMPRKNTVAASRIVQMIGGLGDPGVQVQATRLTGRLAHVTGATPVFLAAPGLVGSRAVRDALLGDPSIVDVVRMWDELTVALVGIGSLDPSPLMRRSGNAMTEQDQQELRELGAVGDVCLRYFDMQGRPVRSPLDDRLVGITPEGFTAIPRRIGVAGGQRKVTAVRAALLGGWVNVLITDRTVAEQLIA